MSKTWQEWQAIVEAPPTPSNNWQMSERNMLEEYLLRELAGYRQNSQHRSEDRDVLRVVLRLVEQHARKLERADERLRGAA